MPQRGGWHLSFHVYFDSYEIKKLRHLNNLQIFGIRFFLRHIDHSTRSTAREARINFLKQTVLKQFIIFITLYLLKNILSIL